MSTPKFLQSFFLALLIPICASAQQNVGIGTSSPTASAMLDVSSTNKGMLVPRLTTTQMNAIASPANGLLVYNTDSTAFAYRSDSAWVYLEGKSNASNDWSTKGNAGTSPTTSFIGTTDDQDVIFKRNNVRAGLLNNSVENTSFGVGALNAASTGTNNTAIGKLVLGSNTTGQYNTAIGAYALRNNTEGFNNTATGEGALFSNTTGNNNTAHGFQALPSNTTGNGNTAHGFQALFSNTIGYVNTATGIQALLSNTTGSYNTANGTGALYNNMTGNGNTTHGFQALFSNTTGNSNTANGFQALFSNTTRSNLVAVGDSALYNNGVGATLPDHATKNTALGSKALFGNTLGDDNTAVGFSALKTNTTGVNNTAVGTQALENFNSGFNNVAIGLDAMKNKTSGNNNVAIGTGSLLFNTNGSTNTALGVDAGIGATGSDNVFLGYNAGANETGSHKLYINNNNGNSANSLIYGEFDTDKLRVNNMLGIGMQPLSVGASDEYAQLQIKQKSSQRGLGITGADNTDRWEFAVSNVSSDLELYYNNTFKGLFAKGGGNYIPSDRRLKKDIIEYAPVLSKINRLQAFNYHYLDNNNDDPLSSGFMAQDVQQLFPDAVTEIQQKNGDKFLGINYQYFTVAAIKGLQEQQAIIDSQEKRIAKLEEMVKALMEK